MDQFKHTAIQILEDNLTHLFYNKESAFVFDPAEPDIIKLALSKNLTKKFYKKEEITLLENLKSPRKLHYSFTTHKHWDHAAGNKEVLKFCENVFVGDPGIKSYEIPPHTDTFTEGIFESELFDIYDIDFETFYTPCHTKDSYCFYLRIEDKKYLITGDTFFYLGVGKFFEGSAQDMCDNAEKIKENVSDDCVLLYGHDYRSYNISFVEDEFWNVPEELKKKVFLTYKEEKLYNPFFNLHKIDSNKKDCEKMQDLRDRKDIYQQRKIWKI